MSPTIHRVGPYRFFFNSREESRIHVHITTSDGTAKFWLEPIVALANFHNLKTKDLRRIEAIIKEYEDELSLPGTVISHSEVTNIGAVGFWMLVDDKEYFVSFDDYPVFCEATVAQIYAVQRLSPTQFHWPELDADVELGALEHPEQYPLAFRD